MRISGFALGILGFILLIVFTGICAIFSFSFTRDGVIDAWEGGIYVESIGEVAGAIINPADFTAQTVEEPTGIPVVIPSITPIATMAPADETQVAVATESIAEATPIPTEQFVSDIWRDPREVNILLMGIDEREGFTTETAYRTDTMMVLHINPVDRSAGLISFPRDLYVTVPGYGQNRLNRANYIGDLNFYPDEQGPGLLMATINSNFGIRIDHYVMINFTVFETVIDRIAPDGIEICVDEYINDPTYPDAGFGTIQVEFQVGCQRLNGERLLQYARTRKTEGGDIDRTRRQQEVMEATRQYVVGTGGARNLLGSIGALWSDLSGSYRTNLSLNEITGLALLMNEITDISYTSLTPGYWLPRTLENGDQILVPVPSAIQQLIQETFYPGAELSLADLKTRADAESVLIRVYNNTLIQGLAGNAREFLIGNGIAVEEVWNMPDPDSSPTRLQYYGTGRDTAIYLAALFGIPAGQVVRGNDGLAASGVIVVVGFDMPDIISGNN